MKRFSELSLSPLLKNNLEKHGFTQTTPIQSQAIEPALAGEDLIATAPTGSGKTLAFVLPIIQRLARQGPPAGIRAVILSPTRELAIQIHETFATMAAGSGVGAAVVVGGLGEALPTASHPQRRPGAHRDCGPALRFSQAGGWSI